MEAGWGCGLECGDLRPGNEFDGLYLWLQIKSPFAFLYRKSLGWKSTRWQLYYSTYLLVVQKWKLILFFSRHDDIIFVQLVACSPVSPSSLFPPVSWCQVPGDGVCRVRLDQECQVTASHKKGTESWVWILRTVTNRQARPVAWLTLPSQKLITVRVLLRQTRDQWEGMWASLSANISARYASPRLTWQTNTLISFEMFPFESFSSFSISGQVVTK